MTTQGAGEEPLTSFALARDALAIANNQAATETCEQCDSEFLAQGPCDLTCTACRLTEATDG